MSGIPGNPLTSDLQQSTCLLTSVLLFTNRPHRAAATSRQLITHNSTYFDHGNDVAPASVQRRDAFHFLGLEGEVEHLTTHTMINNRDVTRSCIAEPSLTCEFSWMRDCVTLLGIVTTPRCVCHLKHHRCVLARGYTCHCVSHFVYFW